MKRSTVFWGLFPFIFGIALTAIVWLVTKSPSHKSAIERYFETTSKYNGRVIAVSKETSHLTYYNSERVVVRARVAITNAYGAEIKDNRVFIYGNPQNPRDAGKITTMLTETEAIQLGATDIFTLTLDY